MNFYWMSEENAIEIYAALNELRHFEISLEFEKNKKKCILKRIENYQETIYNQYNELEKINNTIQELKDKREEQFQKIMVKMS